jgi:hypothetical protein
MQRRYLTCTVPRSKNKYPPRSERPPQSKYPFKNRLAERPPSESAERPSFNSTHPSQNSRATFNSSGSKYPSSRANSNSNYPSQNTRAPFNSSESKYPSSRANSNSNYPPQQSRRELSPPFAHSESKYAYSSTRNFKSQHPSSDSVAERRPSFTSKSKYPSIDNHTKRPPVFEPFLGNRKQPQVLDAFRRNAIDNHQLQYEKPLDPERNPAREKKISRKTLKIAQTTSYKLLRDVAFSETIVEGNRGTRALKGIVERHEARAMMNDQKSFDIPNLGMADEELLDVSFAPGSFVEARRSVFHLKYLIHYLTNVPLYPETKLPFKESS